MATALSSIADNSSKRSLKVSRRGTRVVNASEANTHTLIFHDLPHLALRLAHSYCPRMQGPLSPHSRSRVIVACAFRVCVRAEASRMGLSTGCWLSRLLSLSFSPYVLGATHTHSFFLLFVHQTNTFHYAASLWNISRVWCVCEGTSGRIELTGPTLRVCDVIV